MSITRRMDPFLLYLTGQADKAKDLRAYYRDKGYPELVPATETEIRKLEFLVTEYEAYYHKYRGQCAWTRDEKECCCGWKSKSQER
jgi:hypothetical protein